MGSGKRKYNHRGKYIPKEKKLGKYEEEKAEHDPEKVKELLALWNERKEKKKWVGIFHLIGLKIELFLYLKKCFQVQFT